MLPKIQIVLIFDKIISIPDDELFSETAVECTASECQNYILSKKSNA